MNNEMLLSFTSHGQR